MPLEILNFEQTGPTGAIQYPSLDNAQFTSRALAAAPINLKHTLVCFRATEAGKIVITCPGQGPVTIPISIDRFLNQIFYIPHDSFVQFIAP